MAVVLKASSEEIRSLSNDINTQADMMYQSILVEIAKCVDYITTQVWVSDSGTKYRAQCEFLVREINDALNRLKQHSQNLSEAATAYEQLERDQESTVTNIGDENIF